MNIPLVLASIFLIVSYYFGFKMMYLNSMNGFDEAYSQNPFRVLELFNKLISKTNDGSKLKKYKKIKFFAISSIIAVPTFGIIGIIYEIFSDI